MDYTGRILVGKGFIHDYYIHMGFQRAWAYETLKEFVFENGKLINVVDHSKIAAELRELIDRDPEEFDNKLHEDIIGFVNSSFSLDFENKAWWL